MPTCPPKSGSTLAKAMATSTMQFRSRIWSAMVSVNMILYQNGLPAVEPGPKMRAMVRTGGTTQSSPLSTAPTTIIQDTYGLLIRPIRPSRSSFPNGGFRAKACLPTVAAILSTTSLAATSTARTMVTSVSTVTPIGPTIMQVLG